MLGCDGKVIDRKYRDWDNAVGLHQHAIILIACRQSHCTDCCRQGLDQDWTGPDSMLDRTITLYAIMV